VDASGVFLQVHKRRATPCQRLVPAFRHASGTFDPRFARFVAHGLKASFRLLRSIPTAKTGRQHAARNRESGSALGRIQGQSSKKTNRRRNMNAYQTSTPRAAFVIAALALTALTIGVSVVAPAKMDSGGQEVGPLAAPRTVTPTQVVINPARIEVVAAREPGFISVHVRNIPAKRKQQS
jgi:hypothetical protein